ncbi:metal ABC transporter solute-binding protein, Zn/Mn family [Rubrimonas cliftonensis]|uniref:Zinc/manganese transport system substrate-binding protein n=1 Tax=Rubrimonas cliftonensis TaxID=89524 RepID=A0A1H4EYR9_9RHOB|nr:zinc ABC transporter substrate-binding protein [Rubrimonas cliftonensis]SEA90195.1 zinc/manganese transport system substrate-binding protein [Rubrimonas cliftonensis]
MLTRRLLLSSALALLPLSALAAERLKVVASFSILGDMVAQVGGDRIALTTLVGPDGDAHVYQPTPAAARAVAAADLVIVNGLGFEGWIERLIEASAFTGPVTVASEGIDVLETADDHDEAHGEGHAHDHDHDHDHGHDHGDVDPHAWQSVPAARVYVANIADALIAADPASADAYAASRDAYLKELAALEAEIAAAVAALPPERRVVVTSHDAFGYFARDTGLEFLAPQGVSTEAEASAQDVAALITQIRERAIPAIFVETIADPRLLQQIERETDARIGGALYSDALSGPDGPAPTYLDMMRHNLRMLTEALSG